MVPQMCASAYVFSICTANGKESSHTTNLQLCSTSKSQLHIPGCGWCMSVNCLFVDKWVGIGKGVHRERARHGKNHKRSKILHGNYKQWLQWTLVIVFNTRFHFSFLYVRTHFSAIGCSVLYQILYTLPPLTTKTLQTDYPHSTLKQAFVSRRTERFQVECEKRSEGWCTMKQH